MHERMVAVAILVHWIASERIPHHCYYYHYHHHGGCRLELSVIATSDWAV